MFTDINDQYKISGLVYLMSTIFAFNIFLVNFPRYFMTNFFDMN